MNQLNGKYVNVVLSVEDGRGMDFVKHVVHIAANFNGRLLESDATIVYDRTPFNTELIWEIEKKDLRKVRSSNQPLRVECISTDPHNRKDRLGFLLLSLRSAQVIPVKEARTPLNFKWHKLIGCQADKKKHKPELYLALAVRDHIFSEQEEIISYNTPFISEEDAAEESDFISEHALKYLDDGYIQVGEDEDVDSYSLNLLIAEIRNLDTLLPEALVFKQSQEKYHLSFRIFGVTIKTKSFYKQLHDIINLNEKVVVRLLANETTLFEFLSTQRITVTLFNGHDKLGITDIDLKCATFEQDTSIYYFRLPLPNDIVPFGGDDSSPFIEVCMWIKKSADPNTTKTMQEEKPPATKVVISNLLKGCGDQPDNVEQQSELKSKSECNEIGTESPLPITKSVDTVVKSIALSPRQVKTYNVRESYAKFILEITLQNMMWKLPPKENIVIFKFLHPRASNYITIYTQLDDNPGVTIDLNSMKIAITYVSTQSHIENLLNAWPPKLVLTDENEKLLNEELEVDTTKFFSSQQAGYKYQAELKTSKTFQHLAKIQINVNLIQCDLDDYSESTNFQLFPPIVDEILSVKEIADVEKWKRHHKDVFQDDLRRFQESESERLKNIWNDRKKELEETLGKQVESCKLLREELQQKVDTFKTEKYLIRRRNQANIYQEIFEENFEKYKETDKAEIIKILSKTQRDNEYLKKLVEDQRNKLQALEKTTLTKEQTTNLLQELRVLEKQFEEAQDAKKYFKEKWKLACDQIHEIKTEEYKQIQLELKKSRDELVDVNMDSFREYITNKFDLNEEKEL